MRQAATGRTLLPMANPGQKGPCGAAASFAVGPLSAVGLPAPSAGPDSLHSSLGVSGSAVQFNSSVSAMPPHNSRKFARLFLPGTADTLLVRWLLT